MKLLGSTKASYNLFTRVFLIGIICFLQQDAIAQGKGWTQLFNGKDLTGWDTYLRATNMSGYVEDPDLPYQPPIGLNNDPLNVFTVKDGVLRISGEIWGAITSKRAYSNYHLRFETKWGEQKYYPKDRALRDAGLLFHCTGPFDYASKCWMRSLEMQIEESNIGDYYDVYGGVPEFQTSEGISPLNEKLEQYDAFAPLKRGLWRVHRSGNFESPHGEWTRSELVARHADAVFIVNGFVVNRLYNIFREDLHRQVTGGKIQFQSESAEHYFRRIDIRPLRFPSGEPKLVSKDSVVTITAEEKNIEIVNTGDAVEIIAVELMGKNIDHIKVKLPEFPLVLKKNKQLQLPVSIKPGGRINNSVTLRLETVAGPVPDFEVRLIPGQ
ncbi:MAG: DUF1080 domain-containing protein [Chitinophagaceae bacterium]|nr:DUF1080 domain-containing protein [Chitinophagaceae bacterium]MCW5926758.1 DUF1080 domain-containing protein [Chitinophagaceae bacterium]